MIYIHFQPEDLIGLRFAYSPLVEAIMSYKTLLRPERHSLHRRWVEQAQSALADVTFPYMDAAILPERYMADFLTPPPLVTQRNIEDELARLRATPTDVIQKNMQTVLKYAPLTPEREHFLHDPHGALDCLIDELWTYWGRALAPHWSRMMSVLENDILYRARILALHGADALFNDLDSLVRYNDQTIQLDKSRRGCEVWDYVLAGRGLQMTPVVFHDHISYQIEPEWQPMLCYHARGTGNWSPAAPDADPSLRMLLGEGKTQILQLLHYPLNTSELARRLSVTSGAVSQHLSQLAQAGLVESHREKLLELFTE
jgi:hypothetical protein